MQDLAYLLPHASTDKQRATVQAVIDCGGIRAASRQLGRDPKTIHDVIKLLKRRRRAIAAA